MADVEWSGFDELSAWIENFPERTLPLAAKRMDRIAGIVEGILKEYPPADAANAPGRRDIDERPMGYYERGRGSWYPVKQTKTFNGLRLKSQGVIRLSTKKAIAAGVVGYKLSPTSETLGRRWAHTVVRGNGEVVGLIGNSASYAQAVNGAGQIPLMAARGWKNPDQALDEAGPAIGAELDGLLDDITKSFLGGG